MRYGVYVFLSDGRMRPYLSDVRTRRRAQRVACRVNTMATAAHYGWRAFVLDRDNPPPRRNRPQERPAAPGGQPRPTLATECRCGHTYNWHIPGGVCQVPCCVCKQHATRPAAD